MSQLGELNQFLTNWSRSRNLAPAVWNSHNGEFIELHGYSLVLNGNTQVILRANNGSMPNRAVGIGLLQQAAQRIDDFYIGTAYRQVLQNQGWQRLYQVANRTWVKVQGTTLVNKTGATIPCHACGLVVPLKHITVDHQKPQSGGEFAAVLKLFHTLGCHLTHHSAAGSKGAALQSGNIAAIPTKSGTMQVDRAYWRPYRYTLTDEGIVFLSLAWAASGNQLNNYAMHSIVNLSPLCFRCNAKKNNGQVDLSQINDW